jgi:hypothetical protein
MIYYFSTIAIIIAGSVKVRVVKIGGKKVHRKRWTNIFIGSFSNITDPTVQETKGPCSPKFFAALYLSGKNNS